MNKKTCLDSEFETLREKTKIEKLLFIKVKEDDYKLSVSLVFAYFLFFLPILCENFFELLKINNSSSSHYLLFLILFHIVVCLFGFVISCSSLSKLFSYFYLFSAIALLITFDIFYFNKKDWGNFGFYITITISAIMFVSFFCNKMRKDKSFLKKNSGSSFSYCEIIKTDDASLIESDFDFLLKKLNSLSFEKQILIVCMGLSILLWLLYFCIEIVMK